MRRLLALALLPALSLMACSDDGGTEVRAGDGDDPGGDTQTYEATLTVLESPDHGPELCTAVAESYPPQCGGVPVSGWDWSTVEAESSNGTTWGEYRVVGTFDGETFTLTEPPGEPGVPSGLDEYDFSPGCDDPEVVDESHGQAEFEEMSTLSESGIPGSLGTWISQPGEEWDGPFTATVVVETGHTDRAVAFVRQRYGGPLCVIERDITNEEIERIQQEVHDDEAVAAIGSFGSSYDLVEGVFEVEVWHASEEAQEYAHDRWGDVVVLRGILQPVS